LPLFGNVLQRTKVHELECDLYLPKLKAAIEIDGYYWHKNKHAADVKKGLTLKRNGIILFRLRGFGLKQISTRDLIYSEKHLDFNVIKNLLRKMSIYLNLDSRTKVRISQYVTSGKFVQDKHYLELMSQLPGPLLGKSLMEVNPKLSEEWHPTKNADLTPSLVSCGSSQKAWWICKKAKHEWSAVIGNRHRGASCPFCDGRRVDSNNSLLAKNPVFLKEWHPNKNLPVTPNDVTPVSDRTIWWRCEKKGHIWQATIAKRAYGRNCLFCAGKAVSKDNSLFARNKKLSMEWHPTKNRILTPNNVTLFSSKSVWWQCKFKHSWRAAIRNRSAGKTRCPYCYRLKV
jgi:hypothetical protein